MSVGLFKKELCDTWIPMLGDEFRERAGLVGDDIYRLSSRRVWHLMVSKEIGMKYKRHAKSYYVDSHEKEETREARKKYLAEMSKHEIDMYRWIQLNEAQVRKLKIDYPDLPPPHHTYTLQSVDKSVIQETYERAARLRRRSERLGRSLD